MKIINDDHENILILMKIFNNGDFDTLLVKKILLCNLTTKWLMSTN
jgi:hypothetical protein